ncbi:chitinase-3-like protein 1 [Trichogramma pretiosum]|uniref:chitinase-3-like protein 1 n=1 Tax=Trichogramma pretiosum TaxID=7493 RepID=UPI000C71B384|nr:chitinase-3-like protein 1 [Trichogramma pretiosum]
MSMMKIAIIFFIGLVAFASAQNEGEPDQYLPEPTEIDQPEPVENQDNGISEVEDVMPKNSNNSGGSSEYCTESKLYRNPENCGTFYNCGVGHVPYLMECPAGLYFNEELKMKVATILFIGFLAVANAANEKKVVCYYGDWSATQLPPQNIDPNLCTHIIFSFVAPDGNGGVSAPNKNMLDELRSLKNKNPNLKIMVAVGGASTSGSFSPSVSSPDVLQRFVDNLYNLVKQYGLDGIDLDWEYPSQAEKENFSQLTRKLKERLSQDNLLLSAAVYSVNLEHGRGYDIPEISKNLDFINLMTYDLRGAWAPATEINAPLYDGSSEITVDGSVRYWLKSGAPAEKLILGIPFYGRAFTTNGQSKGVGTPASGPGAPGPISQEGGVLNYNEICSNIKNDHWEEFFEESQKVPYAVKGNQWVGYDNPRSINEKVNYAQKNGLGGMMVWAIHQDDVQGVCGEKNALLKAVNNIHGSSGGGVSPPGQQPVIDNNIRPPQGGNQNPPNAIPQDNNNYNNNEVRPNDVGYNQNYEASPNYNLGNPGQPSNQNNIASPDQNNVAPPNQNNAAPPNQNNGVFKRMPAQNNGNSPSSNVCVQEGLVRDPASCGTYYQCVSNGSGGFVSYKMNCAPGTLFDASIQGCNWAQSVQC